MIYNGDVNGCSTFNIFINKSTYKNPKGLKLFVTRIWTINASYHIDFMQLVFVHILFTNFSHWFNVCFGRESARCLLILLLLCLSNVYPILINYFTDMLRSVHCLHNEAVSSDMYLSTCTGQLTAGWQQFRFVLKLKAYQVLWKFEYKM